MLSKEKKLAIAEQITNSNTFKKAPTSIALLQYLVQCNIDKRSLKESIIDIEFFGGQADSDKSNPRVRVNIYNLRNKLQKYYANEGADDAWQVKIDKGQYALRFEKQGIAETSIPILPPKQWVPYVLLAAALVALGISHLPKAPPKIWKSFFTNGQSTNLFIGDAFGYSGTTISGGRGWTRDYNINSVEEYYQMVQQKPELKELTHPIEFNYSTRMAEHAAHDLAHFFSKWDKNFEIKYATQSSFNDIKNGNTIYVGRMKNQHNFTYLFNEANPYFKIKDGCVEFSKHKVLPDTTIKISYDWSQHDHAVVSRVPGPNHTEHFFFFSDHDIGVMATMEYFTNPDSLALFSKRHLKGNSSFTAVFKAKGQGRIDLTLEQVLVVGF